MTARFEHSVLLAQLSSTLIIFFSYFVFFINVIVLTIENREERGIRVF